MAAMQALSEAFQPATLSQHKLTQPSWLQDPNSWFPHAEAEFNLAPLNSYICYIHVIQALLSEVSFFGTNSCHQCCFVGAISVARMLSSLDSLPHHFSSVSNYWTCRLPMSTSSQMLCFCAAIPRPCGLFWSTWQLAPMWRLLPLNCSHST